MRKVSCILFVCFNALLSLNIGGALGENWSQSNHSQEQPDYKHPTVLIAILVRNKAHTLPYFLSLLENLNYPKDRIALWIRGDHSIDKSYEILNKWLNSVEDEYSSINAGLSNDEEFFYDERGIAHWSDARFRHVINLREAALEHARNIWADYLLVIDCDVFLTNPNVLKNLVDKNYPISAPMLKSDGLYSNFWHGMTEDYYYLRTEDYKTVLNREKVGCFNVPMVHSCVLINLKYKKSDLLTYKPSKLKPKIPDIPEDDIIVFAISANRSGIPLMVCNEEINGFIMVPLEKEDGFENDYQQLTNLKLEILTENKPLYVNELLKPYVKIPEKDTLTFDKIYMINLLRRPERRIRMKQCFDELGLNAMVFDAVDGKTLDEKVIQTITFLPEYADPYSKRPMTTGEIGCFLSHYYIWQDIVKNGYEESLILEDDIRFEPYFRLKVQNLMQEVRQMPEWDLVYFGRKRLQEDEEHLVDGFKYLVHAGYSYWTLGYLLSLNGAKKLLDSEPLTKLLPVDEFLPILFDKHPQDVWKSYFPNRNLIGLSAKPLLLYPTHYTGEVGYISDTEDSIVVKPAHEDL